MEEEDSVSKSGNKGTIREIVKVKKPVGANIFLDSGATESNYIRQDVVSSLLRTHKNKQAFLQPYPTNVCGAFGQCQLSSHCIKIYVTIPAPLCTMQCNNINNKKDGNKIARIVHLVFRILRNLPYDIIIGRPDIIKYNLWYLLGSKHGDHEENINHKIIYDPP